MNRRALLISLLILLLVLLAFNSLQAVGKPDVTSHEATFLGSTVNMHIEWQSPNPIVMVKISIANKQQDIKVDPYDNRRNPSGYAGEVTVTIGLDWTPNQPFNYVIQLEDELRMKSELITGMVKVPVSQQPQYPQYPQQPGMIMQPQQPGMQIQIQQNIPQPGIQIGTQPGIQPGPQPFPQPGIQPGAQPTFQPPQQPGIQFPPQPGMQPGAQPFPQSNIQPGAQIGGQQAGTIIVIIVPQIVADSGAMWRVGNSPWKRSGEAIPNLPMGFHTIEFQDVGNWIKPQNLNVTIEGGQTLTLNGIYNSR